VDNTTGGALAPVTGVANHTVDGVTDLLDGLLGQPSQPAGHRGAHSSGARDHAPDKDKGHSWHGNKHESKGQNSHSWHGNGHSEGHQSHSNGHDRGHSGGHRTHSHGHRH
ncbi:MAG: hypothetical protein JWM79_559, partial [Nocardioides sp.]|nr:hypothetical protein [Nocardioides sp.]